MLSKTLRTEESEETEAPLESVRLGKIAGPNGLSPTLSRVLRTPCVLRALVENPTREDTADTGDAEVSHRAPHEAW